MALRGFISALIKADFNQTKIILDKKKVKIVDQKRAF